MGASLIDYFTDAVLRGPTIGSMLMCLAASLIGVIIFLRKQSLLGEALSHAAYPGVIIGVICAGLILEDDVNDAATAIFILLGAFCTALLGLVAINWLERGFKIRTDSALCFALSVFFGIGLTLASDVQFSFPALYRQAQSYLYGQASTMMDVHIIIYGALAIVVILTTLLLGKELQTITFNRDFAKSIGMKVSAIDAIIFILTALSVVIGIRSVGVVLMSAMLIAPAAAARQYTNNFHIMLLLAGLFGVISGFFGNYISVELSQYLAIRYPGSRLAMPTGPTIVLVASSICFLSLLFAPGRGLLLRLMRVTYFRHRCIRENILKTLWRFDQDFDRDKNIPFEHILQYQSVSRLYLHCILLSLIREGWLGKSQSNVYRLTSDGRKKASQIVRLHRLWEVYLADYVGIGAERVHHNAEEMEHIITPELERELTRLLKDPQVDPHRQRIPPMNANMDGI